jgi:predicted aminopeptidase
MADSTARALAQPRTPKRRVRLALAAAACVAMTSCANIGYYLQSVRGQLDIWSRQEDIETVLQKPDTPQVLKEKLAAVLEIRNFASAELALPQNRSYRTYANLRRPFAVWNVFATAEFSIQPKQWCFAFAGCVNYRGYFSKADAEEFAQEIEAQGYDAFVGGVPAYSLLGYFPDPVLNTFVNYPVPHLARLIFHELAHQVVYVRDDSVFNESFAVAVEEEGLRRWLDRNGSEADRVVYARMRQRRADFVNLIETYRGRLDALYRSGLPAAEMRAGKSALFAQLAEDYRKLKADWGGFAGYDRWFAQKPNNALLASVSLYTRRVPAFRALLEREGRDMPRFYAAVKALARLDKAGRALALEGLAPEAPAATANAH